MIAFLKRLISIIVFLFAVHVGYKAIREVVMYVQVNLVDGGHL